MMDLFNPIFIRSASVIKKILSPSLSIILSLELVETPFPNIMPGVVLKLKSLILNTQYNL
jgi:hypothetical protein